MSPFEAVGSTSIPSYIEFPAAQYELEPRLGGPVVRAKSDRYGMEATVI
jgi:hypothetical protein